MNDQLAHEINPLLDIFLTADETVSAGLLTELIDERVEPLVKALIRGKLHVSLQLGDERQINQDARDLVSEVKTRVVAKLTRLKSDDAAGAIENLDAYVKTVALNECNHYLRKRHPNRLRLKNQLRYLLTHHAPFSLWTPAADVWVCGRREWKDIGVDLEEINISGQSVDELNEAFDKDGISASRLELADLVSAVFRHIDRPLRFDGLVSIVYDLRQTTEPVEEAEDETGTGKNLRYESDLLDRLEQAAFLKTLWDEIGRLPLRHRAALLLNLKNSQGEGLITLLPLTRVATIRQIAENLEFSVEEFARIWNDLPWDDRTIADHLKLTRQQVINLRQSARATLRRRLNYF